MSPDLAWKLKKSSPAMEFLGRQQPRAQSNQRLAWDVLCVERHKQTLACDVAFFTTLLHTQSQQSFQNFVSSAH